MLVFLWVAQNGNFKNVLKLSKDFTRQQARFSKSKSADATFGTDNIKEAIACGILFSERIQFYIQVSIFFIHKYMYVFSMKFSYADLIYIYSVPRFVDFQKQ